MRYAHPGTEGSLVTFKTQYGNYIGGEFVPPVKGQYFENTSPITGKLIAEFPRSTAEDIDKALDAAHAAADAWGKTSVQERSLTLLKIADRIEQNLEILAITETWDNGKAVRETLNADIPLAVDHFRYFAGVLRAQEGTAAEIDGNTVAYHIHEPLGVVGQIIPWNFPLLMAAWKLAPALAAGNCIVLKPAEQTPLGITVLMELIGDLLPKGVLNVVQGRSLHLPVALPGPGVDLPAVHGSGDEEGPEDPARRSAGHRDHGRRRRTADGWQSRKTRGLVGHRLLHPADAAQGQQQDAGLPGRNLRPGGQRDHVQGRSGSRGHRQRHRVRAGCWRLDPRHQPRV
nr:aldehyde dehydrogenase family 2 member B4, mitochondrial [Tanacetum cinerariifolium]